MIWFEDLPFGGLIFFIIHTAVIIQLQPIVSNSKEHFLTVVKLLFKQITLITYL